MIMSGFPSIATCKDRLSCEVNRIGATGVEILLPTRTTICVGVRTAQKVQDSWMNGSNSCWFTE
jgi:hypothetical protein